MLSVSISLWIWLGHSSLIGALCTFVGAIMLVYSFLILSYENEGDVLKHFGDSFLLRKKEEKQKAFLEDWKKAIEAEVAPIVKEADRLKSLITSLLEAKNDATLIRSYLVKELSVPPLKTLSDDALLACFKKDIFPLKYRKAWEDLSNLKLRFIDEISPELNKFNNFIEALEKKNIGFTFRREHSQNKKLPHQSSCYLVGLFFVKNKGLKGGSMGTAFWYCG